MYRYDSISCLPDSIRNLAREFVQVSGNWLADELPCPTSSHDIGWYQVLLIVLNLMFFLHLFHSHIY